jgi:hypothetical protein
VSSKINQSFDENKEQERLSSVNGIGGNMNTDKVSLVTIYSECSNHLRDMDKNRDQLISFYIVLTGALLAAFNYMNQDTQRILLCASSILLFVLGGIVSILANNFRIWHTRYAYTATLLTALGRAKKSEFVKVHNEILKHSYELDIDITSKNMPLRWCFFGRYMGGTEFFTYLAAVIVTSLPLSIVIYELIVIFYPANQLTLSDPLIILVFFLVSFFYLLISIYFSARDMYRKFSKCPWATWLLYGVDKDLDSTLVELLKK